MNILCSNYKKTRLTPTVLNIVPLSSNENQMRSIVYFLVDIHIRTYLTLYFSYIQVCMNLVSEQTLLDEASPVED